MAELSVIIPVYNSVKFLSRCIESIINQTYKDLELILVNDGSTDNSLEICRQYAVKDHRISVIDKKNEGSGPTRNAGIRASTGKYLAFPDSDDRMELDAYERCMEIMHQFDIDLLVFGMKTEIYDDFSETIEEVVEDSIPEIQYHNQEEFRKKWAWLYQNMDMGSPCNKIYKKSIVDQYNLSYPPLRRMQDGVFNMYFADKVTSFKSINRNFFIRTWHAKEFQRRKMPPNFIECAIFHHKTLEEMLSSWGVYRLEDKIYFGAAFSETIMTAEMDYLPSENPSLFETYKHIKKINSNEYISKFYHEYRRIKKLRKREYAMLKRWNLLLAVEVYWKIKRGS